MTKIGRPKGEKMKDAKFSKTVSIRPSMLSKVEAKYDSLTKYLDLKLNQDFKHKK